jgi:transcriptional regulator with XRE-family HTH domain
MELTLEEFGKRLSVVRHARHRTQKEFGAPIGLSKTAMSKVEHGTQNLDYMQVATLAEAHRFCLNALYKPYWDITACLQTGDEPKPEAPK